MRNINVYNFISLNGFFKGANGDLSWHKHGQQESEYGNESMKAENILLFGRVTYEMMKSYWPTPMASEQNPLMAENMNKAEKIVCSKTLQTADWQNTTIIRDLIADITKLKQTPGKDITVLGSGSIVSQLADNGLLDTFQIMLDPVALASGTPVFSGITKQLDFRLVNTRTFQSGVVLLSYEKA